MKITPKEYKMLLDALAAHIQWGASGMFYKDNGDADTRRINYARKLLIKLPNREATKAVIIIQ